MNEKEKEVYEALSDVVDPEIGVPITQMNLVDEVKVEGEKAQITFHLSTPMCPPFFAVKIGTEIYMRALKVEGIKDVEVKAKGHLYEEMINQNISDAVSQFKDLK